MDQITTRVDRSVAGYVTRRSLAPRELWGTLRGLAGRREATLVILALGGLGVAALGRPVAGLLVAVVALALAMGQVRGTVTAIGLYDDERLIGGLRLRIDKRRRRAWLVGLYVEPSYRGRRLARVLLAAALRYVQDDLSNSGKVIAYAPTHPASQRLVDGYLPGRQLRLGSPEFACALSKLDSSLS